MGVYTKGNRKKKRVLTGVRDPFEKSRMDQKKYTGKGVGENSFGVSPRTLKRGTRKVGLPSQSGRKPRKWKTSCGGLNCTFW